MGGSDAGCENQRAGGKRWAVAWCERRTGKTLAPSQREALKTVLANRVVVITGGPGVGKTTLVNSDLRPPSCASVIYKLQ